LFSLSEIYFDHSALTLVLLGDYNSKLTLFLFWLRSFVMLLKRWIEKPTAKLQQASINIAAFFLTTNNEFWFKERQMAIGANKLINILFILISGSSSEDSR